MPAKTSVVASSFDATDSSFIGQLDELTINWHVTEACNYRCQYCYAHWKDRPDPRELFHDPRRTRTLLDELFRFFHPDNAANPLRKNLSWKFVRLNLAGGEPTLLHHRLLAVASVAREIGFRLSIISNGSGLSRDMLEELVPSLSYLGISLDSVSAFSNREIGRIDRKGRLLDIGRLAADVRWARTINPRMAVKLNTVVNRLNAEQDLSELVAQFQPDRWKLLRMLPVVDQSLAVSDEQFLAFVDRHRAFRAVQCIEDSQDMCESYLMVDPFGRLFQNRPAPCTDGYVYSQPIVAVGAATAFSQIAFNSSGFQSRYAVESERADHAEV